MATNTAYKTAGLPVAKNAGQAPTAGQNTAYKTAGLPPVVLATAAGQPTAKRFGGIPFARHQGQNVQMW